MPEFESSQLIDWSPPTPSPPKPILPPATTSATTLSPKPVYASTVRNPSPLKQVFRLNDSVTSDDGSLIDMGMVVEEVVVADVVMVSTPKKEGKKWGIMQKMREEKQRVKSPVKDLVLVQDREPRSSTPTNRISDVGCTQPPTRPLRSLSPTTPSSQTNGDHSCTMELKESITLSTRSPCRPSGSPTSPQTCRTTCRTSSQDCTLSASLRRPLSPQQHLPPQSRFQHLVSWTSRTNRRYSHVRQPRTEDIETRLKNPLVLNSTSW